MNRLVFTIVMIVLVGAQASAQIRNYSQPQATQPTSTTSTIDYQQPKDYEIAEITVTGTQYLDQNALISISGLQVGDKIKIPGPSISKAIENLWQQQLLEDVRIYATKFELGKVYLNIELKERPRLTRYTFEGVSQANENELDDQIDLLRGRIISDAMIKNTRMSVRKFYVDKGFRNVEVRVMSEPDSVMTNGQRLRIVVDRKDKVHIDHIFISGNENISDTRLKWKMKKTREQVRFTIVEDLFGRLFRWKFDDLKEFDTNPNEFSLNDIAGYVTTHVKLNFFNGSKVIDTEYQDGLDDIIALYNTKGYRDAEITSDTIYDASTNMVNIEINVDEGPKYFIRDISWAGNFIYSDEQLGGLLGIEKGEVYNRERIDKRLTFDPQEQDLSALYMDDGYLFFNVNPVEVGIENDSIDLEMQVFEGQQATINRVIIQGNDRTRDHVIRREIRTLPGEKFSRSNLIRTQRELSTLGYFDPEQIGIVPMPNQEDGTVDIEYTLVERPNDQIELSGGWGGFYGFVGTVGLVFNNFSTRNIFRPSKWDPLPVGDGQKFAVRVQANGRRYQNYSVTFSEPWLGGKNPNSFSTSLTRSVIRQIPVGTDTVTGSFSVNGLTIGLGRRTRWPDDYFLVNNSLSYNIYDVRGQSTFYGSSLGFTDGAAHAFTFNQTISRNSIDNPMFPRSGSNVTLSATFTPPYSMFWTEARDNLEPAEKYKWVEYHKWMLDVWHYEELADKLVLNARAHLGFLGRYSKLGILGPFERFILGGDGITQQNFVIGQDNIGLRGYENQSLTPPFNTANPANTIQGGIAFSKFVLELRYGVSLNQAATIYVLGFAEAGNNFDNYAEYNPFRLYKSAGLGARVFMPAFGLLGVDWAYGFDAIPGTNVPSGNQFHFSIGQPIR